MSLAEKLNLLRDDQARQAFENCCAAPQWIEQMLSRRPFAGDATVFANAQEIWSSLSREQWLAAFAAHPKIGDLASLQKKFQNTTEWAAHEQSGVEQANDQTLHELSRCNRLYEEKFGYIFIVCATGKSASEMLSLLKSRIENDANMELSIAAAEQLKITLLRLEKLAAPSLGSINAI
jgi:2-oxo-4-hydroxy-4-carboxy-5-ureidoimidazoline decarboxylase